MKKVSFRLLLLSLVIPLALLVVVAVTINYYLYVSEVNTLKERQATDLQEIVSSITAEVHNAVFATASVQGLFISSDNVELTEFQDFTANQIAVLQGQAKTISLGWVDSEGIVKYINPVSETNSNLIGMNTGLYPNRAAAISVAKISKTEAVTEPFEVLQGYPGVIIYAPIFKKNVYQGVSFAVVKLSDLTKSVEDNVQDGVVQIVTDNTIFTATGDGVYDLDGNIIPETLTNTTTQTTIDVIKGKSDVVSSEVTFANQIWTVYYQTSLTNKVFQAWLPYLVLTLIFSTPVVILLIVNYRARLRTEKAYLYEMSLRKELELEVAQREKYEEQIRMQNQELQVAASNPLAPTLP